MKQKPWTHKNGEARELTEEFFRTARPGREFMTPEQLAMVREHKRRRGLGKKPAKEPITLRLDPDVIAYYRAKGAGWQTRINDDLRKRARL